MPPGLRTQAFLVPHQLKHLFEGAWQCIWVSPSGLGHVGPPPSATTDDLGDIANDVARMYASFHKVRGHGGNELHGPLAPRAQYD